MKGGGNTGVGQIYFLRPLEGPKVVKIGWSKDPARRLITYMRWSPVRLEIVAALAGTQALERRFHALFEPHHSHHEWFHASPLVNDTIEAIRRGAFDLDTLPRGRNLYGPGAPIAHRWNPPPQTEAA